jgi:hypothetical protein
MNRDGIKNPGGKNKDYYFKVLHLFHRDVQYAHFTVPTKVTVQLYLHLGTFRFWM